jgi:hypothetical protein
MARTIRTPGLIAWAVLLALPAGSLQAALPVALAAPAPLAGLGPGLVILPEAVAPARFNPGPDDAAEDYETPVQGLLRLLEVDLGPEPEPEWTLPSTFVAAYPGDTCRNHAAESQLDQLASQFRAVRPGEPLTDREATALSENLSEILVVEEYVASPRSLIRDLDEYVCQVRKAWSASGAPDRNRVLFERLYAAKGQRQALSVATRDAEKVKAACLKRLKENPERWWRFEVDDDPIIPEWLSGVPDPLQLDLLQEAIKALADAKQRFDRNVLPLLQDLKKHHAAPVPRDPGEAIEGAPAPAKEARRPRKRSK